MELGSWYPLANFTRTFYNFNGTSLSGTTFTGIIAYSLTGGILNGSTYSSVALTFGDGSVLDQAVFTTPDSGEHEATNLIPHASGFGLITTQYAPGFTSDPVCTLTQLCADETTFGHSVSVIQGQQVESASITRQAASVTPEPSSIALLGTGMLGVVGMMRKRWQG